MSDMIHRPNHYTWRGGMECIDIAKELCQGANGVRAYLIGCLDKAIECLTMLRKIEASSQK